MNFDPRVETEIASQPYPLLFATISGALEDAYQSSSLPEAPAGKAALNDLLIRLRMNQ